MPPWLTLALPIIEAAPTIIAGVSTVVSAAIKEAGSSDDLATKIQNILSDIEQAAGPLQQAILANTPQAPAPAPAATASH
jgi:hypothetical protein